MPTRLEELEAKWSAWKNGKIKRDTGKVSTFPLARELLELRHSSEHTV